MLQMKAIHIMYEIGFNRSFHIHFTTLFEIKSERDQTNKQIYDLVKFTETKSSIFN